MTRRVDFSLLLASSTPNALSLFSLFFPFSPSGPFPIWSWLLICNRDFVCKTKRSLVSCVVPSQAHLQHPLPHTTGTSSAHRTFRPQTTRQNHYPKCPFHPFAPLFPVPVSLLFFSSYSACCTWFFLSHTSSPSFPFCLSSLSLSPFCLIPIPIPLLFSLSVSLFPSLLATVPLSFPATNHACPSPISYACPPQSSNARAAIPILSTDYTQHKRQT